MRSTEAKPYVLPPPNVVRDMSALEGTKLNWQRWTGERTFGPQEVLVWRAQANEEESTLSRLWMLLSEGERGRASALRTFSQRAEFITAHAMLRELLGVFIGCAPAKVEFQTNHYGRPEVANSDGVPIHFNLSHSSGMILIALARIPKIGIDVERVHAMPDYLDLAQRFFADDERNQIERSSMRAFFRCWTRKEAFVKATGQGLALPLNQFSVSVGDDEPAKVKACAWDPTEASHWALADCDPAEGFAATVAVRLLSPAIRYFDFDLSGFGAILRRE